MEGAAFCNRKKELADLAAAVDSSEKLFLYSERRLGKTSLVQTALRQFPKGRYASAYIDLSPTDGEPSFVAATARAITESMSSTAGQLLDVAKQFFSRLTPSVTADAEGRPKVTFGFNRTGQRGLEIEEVLAAPAKIAERGKRKVAIVFDEVQQVLEYECDMVERRLRSIIQKHQDVSYIFLGSRKHLIQKMFLDRSRPLYRAAGHYPLGSIATARWIPFIARKFREGQKVIANDAIQGVCKLTEGHPFCTQHLCHALWDLCEPGELVTEFLIQAAMKVLLDRENYAYTALWESLVPNQKRLLKGSRPNRLESNRSPVLSSGVTGWDPLRIRSGRLRVCSIGISSTGTTALSWSAIGSSGSGSEKDKCNNSPGILRREHQRVRAGLRQRPVISIRLLVVFCSASVESNTFDVMPRW